MPNDFFKKYPDCWKVISRLLHDSLFIAFGVFVFAIVLETVFPGLVFPRLNPSGLIIFLGLNLLAIQFLNWKLEISSGNGKKNKAFFALLMIFSTASIFQSLMKTDLFFAVLAIVLSLPIMWLVYRLCFEKD